MQEREERRVPKKKDYGRIKTRGPTYAYLVGLHLGDVEFGGVDVAVGGGGARVGRAREDAPARAARTCTPRRRRAPCAPRRRRVQQVRVGAATLRAPRAARTAGAILRLSGGRVQLLLANPKLPE